MNEVEPQPPQLPAQPPSALPVRWERAKVIASLVDAAARIAELLLRR